MGTKPVRSLSDTRTTALLLHGSAAGVLHPILEQRKGTRALLCNTLEPSPGLWPC